MLSVIHNPEKWRKNIGICVKCGEFDARTGLCRKGVYHSDHANSGYCPIEDFGPGSNVKPEVWPTEIEARIQTCRGCAAWAKDHCGNDGASILEHARRDVCPMGNYGVMGTIETPAASARTSIEGEAEKGCCGGSG